MDVCAFLDRQGVAYQRFDHLPVYTCEEARAVLPSDMPGAETKNLFLRDKKGKRHFLVVAGYDTTVDLKKFADTVGVQGVSFASPERLMSHLGVEPGSVTLLALVNDAAHAVELYVDALVWEAPSVRAHPLVNTATLVIAHDGVETFLATTGHAAHLVEFTAT